MKHGKYYNDGFSCYFKGDIRYTLLGMTAANRYARKEMSKYGVLQ